MECPPTEDNVLPRNVRTNPVGGWRTTPQAHDAPQVSLQCSHKQKGSPQQREPARQRLRDCKGLEFAEQKKKIVCVRNNPSAALRAAPPLTQGRLGSATPDNGIKFLATGRGDPSPTEFRFMRYAGDRRSLLRKSKAPQKAPSGRGLPRERVGEPARQRTFCKAGKFILLSHPKFDGWYPK